MTILSSILPNVTKHDITDELSKNNKFIQAYLPTMDIDIAKGHHTEGRILTIKCETHNIAR